MPIRRSVAEQRDQLPLRWRMAGLEAAFDQVEERFGPDPAAVLLPAQFTDEERLAFVLLVCSERELTVIPAEPAAAGPAPMPWADVVMISIDVPGLTLEVRTADSHLFLRDVAAGMGGPLRLLGAIRN
jgi:hypothetical protein